MHQMLPPTRPRGNPAGDDDRVEAFREFVRCVDARDFRDAQRWAQQLRQLGYSVVMLESRRAGS